MRPAAAVLVGVLALGACRSQAPERAPALTLPSAQLHPPNAALLAYLGAPVPWPADVNAAFTAEGHRKAVAAACAKIGATLRRVEVDESEYPPVVGVELAYARPEDDDANAFGAALPAPYEWSGSSSQGWDEGGRRFSRIVTCIVPLETVDWAHLMPAMRRTGVRTNRLLESMGADAASAQ